MLDEGSFDFVLRLRTVERLDDGPAKVVKLLLIEVSDPKVD